MRGIRSKSSPLVTLEIKDRVTREIPRKISHTMSQVEAGKEYKKEETLLETS